MIRKLLYLLFLSGIFACNVYGQESFAYKSKWQTKILVGTNIPITNLLQGTNIEYLLQYEDHRSYYCQILSISYFLYKHWGLEFNFQVVTSGNIKEKADNFTASIQAAYSDNYYVHTGDNYNNPDFLSRSQGYLGVIYRWETNKFYVYPKFSIGITSISTDWYGVDLKQKNSNNEYRVNYSSEKKAYDHFTLAPSVSFGYKVLKRLYFNADITFSYYKTNIVFKKEFINLYPKENTVEYFDYKKDIFTLSLGVGLLYVIY